MSFLTQKEKSLIGLINHDSSLSETDKQSRCEAIRQNARLRSDGFRKSVKIALYVIASHRNDKLATKYIK
jgi:hypothetical protein